MTDDIPDFVVRPYGSGRYGVYPLLVNPADPVSTRDTQAEAQAAADQRNTPPRARTPQPAQPAQPALFDDRHSRGSALLMGAAAGTRRPRPPGPQIAAAARVGHGGARRAVGGVRRDVDGLPRRCVGLGRLHPWGSGEPVRGVEQPGRAGAEARSAASGGPRREARSGRRPGDGDRDRPT